MGEQRAPTEAELLEEIDGTWEELNSLLDSLSEAELTGARDHGGWSVKDHVVHITAWERYVISFVQGKAGHEGLGVDEAAYVSGDDAINAVVQRQHKDLPADEALRQLSDVHEQLLPELHSLSDADLQQPYRHYLPDEVDEGEEGPPAFEVIRNSTSNHYRAHLRWIKELLGTAPNEAPASASES